MIAEQRSMQHAVPSATLADVLERVLDKGVVIAGDIKIQIADVDLLTIKIRLMIASVDKAKEMGIDWWEHDSYLATNGQGAKLEEENRWLRKRLAGAEANTRHNPTTSRGRSRSTGARTPPP